MNDEYKELYYFLFNKISDMIQELQQLQQQAEEAYIAGFGHAPKSAAQEDTAAANSHGNYVPPKVTVSHVFVPDEYEGDATASVNRNEQLRDESTLARCQTGSKMLTFERRKAAAQLDMERHKPAAQPEELESAKVLN